jgi:DNA-binding GntR family transcriptional regulator
MTPVILRIMQRGKTRRTIEDETYHQHEAILDAIERRDSLDYQYLMRSHLRRGAVFMKDDLAPSDNDQKGEAPPLT